MSNDRNMPQPQPPRDPGISMGGIKTEIDELRREIQRIKRVIDKQNDPGGVGKPSLFD